MLHKCCKYALYKVNYDMGSVWTLLLLNADTVAFYQVYLWDGLSPIIFSDVSCAGWENTIEECDKKQFLEFSCSKSMVAGALCGSCELSRLRRGSA